MRHRRNFKQIPVSYRKHLRKEKLYLVERYDLALKVFDYKMIRAIERYARKTFGYRDNDLLRISMLIKNNQRINGIIS